MLFLKWRPSAILILRKLQFWSRDLYRHVIFHLGSKFRFDRPIWSRDMAKKRFSIWRPSAILNLKNYRFLSRDLYRRVIFHLFSKYRFDRPIWRRDIAKKTVFNMASVRHLEFAKFRFFVKCTSCELICTTTTTITTICGDTCPLSCVKC